ncbi:MAG TPA: hypothetical protein VER03_19720 [Bryobacteraceae bacterium]|nr:hypothetical protein [Bryobacteraceae bacterium]
MPKKTSTIEDGLILEAALEGLELQKRRIEVQMAEIRSRLGMRQRTPSPQATSASKRSLSADARKRIAAAQKKRWAEYRKSNASSK